MGLRNQRVEQAIVTDQAAIDPNQAATLLALFYEDGEAVDLFDFLQATVAVHQAASTAADVATLKTDFNALLTKLQTAGLMASS